MVVIIIIGGLAAGGWFWAYPKYITQPNPFPATIQNKVSYSLFYPAKLPSGFAISQSSYNLANNTVTYRATKGDKKIVFTMQKAPAGLDFNAFYKQQLTDIQNYTTQFGPGVIGVNDNRQLGSLVANGTWVLLTTNSSSVNRDDISLVMNNLQKY